MLNLTQETLETYQLANEIKELHIEMLRDINRQYERIIRAQGEELIVLRRIVGN